MKRLAVMLVLVVGPAWAADCDVTPDIQARAQVMFGVDAAAKVAEWQQTCRAQIAALPKKPEIRKRQ